MSNVNLRTALKCLRLSQEFSRCGNDDDSISTERKIRSLAKGKKWLKVSSEVCIETGGLLAHFQTKDPDKSPDVREIPENGVRTRQGSQSITCTRKYGGHAVNAASEILRVLEVQKSQTAD